VSTVLIIVISPSSLTLKSTELTVDVEEVEVFAMKHSTSDRLTLVPPEIDLEIIFEINVAFKMSWPML
jgi:hypothetical protein